MDIQFFFYSSYTITNLKTQPNHVEPNRTYLPIPGNSVNYLYPIPYGILDGSKV